MNLNKNDILLGHKSKELIDGKPKFVPIENFKDCTGVELPESPLNRKVDVNNDYINSINFIIGGSDDLNTYIKAITVLKNKAEENENKI